jgi:hypothetical protein
MLGISLEEAAGIVNGPYKTFLVAACAGLPKIANIATMSTTIVISTGMRLIVATSFDVSGTTHPGPVVQYGQV